MARQNLVINPSFTNDASGWVGLNGAGIEHFDFSTRPCVRITKTAYTGQGLVSANYITVLPETSYAYSAYVYIPTVLDGGENGKKFVVAVTWYNSSNAEIRTDASDETTVSIGDGWVRLTQVSTSPTGAVKAKVKVYQTTVATNGKRFLVDSIMLEQSEYVGAFIDVLSQDQETEKVNRALSVYRDLNYITGLQLNADVQLGDLVFNTIDEDDIVWICTDIQGWWSTADPEVPSIPRGFEDGSYDVSGRYAARELTLTGVFIPQRPTDVGVARAKLLEAIDLVREGAWLRTSEEPTKASFVRLVSRPQIQTVNARGRTEFSIGLRAGDPIKYKWDDTKIDGITTTSVNLANSAPNDYVEFTILNEGNASVTTKLVFTGPLGAGSTVSVYHEDDGTTETLTVIESLRAAGPIATITDIEVTNNVALITTQESHGLSVGEVVSVVDTVSASVNTSNATVTSVTDTLPYTFTFTIPGSNNDVDKSQSGGSVSLVSSDVMLVDTYNRNVTVNADATGYRSKLDTLTDWITFHPGTNIVTFTDSIDTVDISSKTYDPLTNQITLTSTKSHFLKVSDKVTIEIPTSAEIAFKELDTNVVTITTSAPHGFSTGDRVDVKTTLSTTITNKALTTNSATLTVADSTAISGGDTVTISMPETAQIVSKSRSLDNVVTLTTSNSATGHGFSNGDIVTVPFQVNAYVASKGLSGNVATITTSATHNFSLNDQVQITLPVSRTVDQKTIAGTQVTLRTTVDHGFSENDRITVALPTSATLGSSRKFGGAAFFNVTFRASSGTTRTITTQFAHGYTAGDTVLIANVDGNYNGTFTIAGTPTTTTFTYDATSIGSLSESTVASEGSVTNTTMSYVVTLNTTGAHNFAVGDSISVNIGIPTSATVTNRQASTSQCTLTIGSHSYATGEVITVSGISSRYNGTFPISSVGATTITYDFNGTTESSTSSGGTVSNLMIANGYNGTKVIRSIPSSTSLTYVYYGQESSTVNSNAGTSPTLTNLTNTAINGTNLVLTSASGTTLQYTRTV